MKKYLLLIPVLWLGCSSFIWVEKDLYEDKTAAEYITARDADMAKCRVDSIQGIYYRLECWRWNFWPFKGDTTHDGKIHRND